MNPTRPILRAILSVSDKSGVVDFAKALRGHGVEIVSTGGTAKALMESGISVVSVDALTGFPEMMDGRLKTLHPRIHGGLLGRRDNPGHVEAMKEHGISPIDLVCVNLYPFAKTMAKPGATEHEVVEQIDIGGPAMIRSASKNYEFVTVVTSAEQFALVVKEMEANNGSTTLALRKRLAAEAFQHTAQYDAMVARWMEPMRQAVVQSHASTEAPEMPEKIQISLVSKARLRYGENPHQVAGLFRWVEHADGGIVDAHTVEGKPLSYNNVLDASAAYELVRDLVVLASRGPHTPRTSTTKTNNDRSECSAGMAETNANHGVAACVVKHTNPCGASIALNASEAFDRAYAGDPLAAYGGIVAISARLTADDASNIAKPDRFLEVVVAESFEPKAVEILAARWKNVRLLAVGSMRRAGGNGLQLKSVPGGVLAQSSDREVDNSANFKLVAGPAPSECVLQDAEFLAVVAKHLKSNAVCIGAQRTLWGAGAGQMDRVCACKHAVEKSALKLSALRTPVASLTQDARGTERGQSLVVTAASDAFFPFDDGPRALIEAGVGCLVHPGGSKRDGDTQVLCEQRSVTLLTTGTRHFRH